MMFKFVDRDTYGKAIEAHEIGEKEDHRAFRSILTSQDVNFKTFAVARYIKLQRTRHAKVSVTYLVHEDYL